MGERGGCATGPYSTLSYIRPHYQDTKSKQLYLIHRNKHREAAKIRRQRQRKMAQMKAQIKTPEKELTEMEINNLSDAEFRTLVIRMLKELRTSTA